VANDFEIAHLNGIHWRKCESSESEYGNIAMMQQVCWLDVCIVPIRLFIWLQAVINLFSHQ
jgi:hypothetical protein